MDMKQKAAIELALSDYLIQMDIDEETHRMGYTLDGRTFYDRNYIKHDYVIINHIKENAAFRKEFNNEILPDYLSFLG